MNGIPEDVMREARKQRDMCGITTYSDMRVHAEHVAAFAILAERRRCAEVARQTSSDCYGNSDQMYAASLIVAQIEAGA